MDLKHFLKRIYPIALVVAVFFVWKYRQKTPEKIPVVELHGTTMGTITYSIKYLDTDSASYKNEIDSLLKVWNMSLSTYIPQSEISRFNIADSCFTFESKYFLPVLQASREVYESSGGAFDPTVGPLVNAWGFGPDKSMAPDSSKVHELLKLIGYNKISFDDHTVCKAIPGMKLDFSAVAKGYAVDVVADYLETKGIHNLLVEIGGELVCRGTKNDQQPWRTAIEDPKVKIYERKILAVVEMQDRAVATSGNYRNYYVRDGKKYAHTIDPTTGYPVQHTLLSASVFADDCMTADAYATAFMVLGVDKAKNVLENHPSLDAFLIYSDDNGKLFTYVTEGIQSNIEYIEHEK